MDEIAGVARSLPAMGTRLVVFSGGEPLLRPEVFEAARLFRAEGASLQLLTSGVLLERCAAEVAREFSRVIVSLDAAGETLYQAVRGVSALTTVERGVASLRRHAVSMPITARATLHRLNFRELPRLIDHAKAMGLDGISFLPADVSSPAFGRESVRNASALMLDGPELADLQGIVEETIQSHRDDFVSGFVQESPAKLRQIPQYYAALRGIAPFPSRRCNAPWVSAVVEADGAVRPCFFHDVIGSIREAPLETIVSKNLRAFRMDLDPGTNPVCARCVCSMHARWRSAPWQ